jgi:transcriptional regulator with XRE-family HTH domain
LDAAVAGKTIYSREQRYLTALLREHREKAGLTQAEVAEKLGRPQSFVSKVESGERRLDLVELRELCRVLGIEVVDFVREFDERVSAPRQTGRRRRS